MEYGSHIWGDSTHTDLQNKVESKAFCLINSPSLTDCLDFLSHRRNVASLSLFYCYFHADFSSKLANWMPPSLPRLRCTRISTSSHPYSVHLSKARVNQYLHSFIPYIGKLWNSLPLSVFPPDLNTFKKGVSSHLMLYRLDLHLLPLFLLVSSVQGLATSGIIFNLFLLGLGWYPFNIWRKKILLTHSLQQTKPLYSQTNMYWLIGCCPPCCQISNQNIHFILLTVL